MRNWSQFAKIFLFIILLLIFSFSWFVFREIPNLQKDLIRERTHATQYPVQIAFSILETYRSRSLSGELSLQEAQARALQTLQGTRYAHNQYFWVHNLSLTMLMHPFNPELIGKDLTDYHDSQGKHIFREINDKIRDQSEGVITYTWPRPGSDIPENKMSCFKYYEPWGWVVGSGIYLDDVSADIDAIRSRVITSVIGAFLCAALFSLYVIYRINQPLRQTIAFARQVENGHAVDTIPINPESEGGKVVGVIKGLLLDLQTAYKRQKSIIEATSDGFFIIGADGIFTEVNHSFSQLTGYSRMELLSLHPEELGPHVSMEIIRNHTAGPGEKGASRFESRYLHKDGTPIDVEISANYTEEASGNVICFVRDISKTKKLEAERKLLEEQLIQAQKMEAIGKLAGGVAHEFNNVLQVIDGYVMLMNEESSNREHKAYLSTILSAVKRASRLTQGMLTYSRQQVFSLSKGNLDETIRQIEPFLEHTMGENRVLTIQTAPEPIWCEMDAQHIQQAIINLVTNARDAIEQHGTISITTRWAEMDHEFVLSHPVARVGTFAVISVADSGSGIDETTRLRIFDPFYTTKDIGKGTGLGLSIVFGIMSQHHGFVTCDTKPGQGSVFSLYLPINAPLEPEATQPVGESTCSGTILLAESDDERGKVLTKVLEKSDYRVLRAADGNEAGVLFSAFRTSIDLLLFDSQLPNKSGQEALAEIRTIDAHIPACFMSEGANEEQELELSESGSNAFLQKPVDHDQLLHIINGLLRPPR
jgi:PAS domain S-box-containing protein